MFYQAYTISGKTLLVDYLHVGQLRLWHLCFITFTHLPFFLTIKIFLHFVQFLLAKQPLLLQALQFLQALHVPLEQVLLSIALEQVLLSQVLGEVVAVPEQAAAAVIDITKNTSIKMLTDLTIVFCIIFPPLSCTHHYRKLRSENARIISRLLVTKTHSEI